MFTYQVRRRVFKLESDQAVAWPTAVEVKFHFQPLQPFGMSASGGRTAIRGVPATVVFDANSGGHTIESKEPLKPLEVLIEEPKRRILLNGNVLTLEAEFESLDALALAIESIYFGYPILLNVDFSDPPIIDRVDGLIGTIAFRWELAEWSMKFRTTTQEEREVFCTAVWEYFKIVSPPERRRLVAALHYFHVACRLSRRGETAGEFLSEVLLNFAKILEVLFPPTGDGNTRNAARAGLGKLGYSDDQIEKDFIPVMFLRNEVDVGHVELGVFTREQLTVLHTYAERVESAFRELLSRVIGRTKSGEFEITPYELEAPNKKATAVIEELRARMSPNAV